MTTRIAIRTTLILALAGVSALAIGRAVEGNSKDRARDSAQDRACRQLDCWASGLNWHTDLEAARAEARASGKPILSLRLLGRLDEELSCTNSRFFRTVLYADPRVSEVLRDEFVLHWQSLRPAPRLTVEFGDGRKLVRTITGNSVHYVLDAEGRVIDALPGLYSPPEFLRQLDAAATEARSTAGLAAGAAAVHVAAFQRERLAEARARFGSEQAATRAV